MNISAHQHPNNRHDWTLLLPSLHVDKDSTKYPRRLLLIGGDERVSTHLRALDFADSFVQCNDASWLDLPSRSFDGLLLLHDAANTAVGLNLDGELAALLSKLKPTGFAYLEIERRRHGYRMWTLRRLRREIQRHSFSVAGKYWPAPNFHASRRYLPLNVAQIFHWYFTHLYVAPTPLSRLIRLLGSALGRWSGLSNQLIASLLPSFSLIAVGPDWKQASSRSRSGVLPGLVVQAQQQNLIPASIEDVALMTSGFDAGSRAVMLLFDQQNLPAKQPSARQRVQPAAVIKVAAKAEFSETTKREQERLIALREELPSSLRQTIPQPLGYFAHKISRTPSQAQLSVSVEGAAPGPSLFVKLRQWPQRSRHQHIYLEQVTSWLVTFHQQTQSEQCLWNEQAIEQWVNLPLRTYEETFRVGCAEKRLFEAVHQRSQQLIGSTLPLVCAHFDLAPWNIHHDGQKLTVIDWELGRRPEEQRGLPLCDLLYFAHYFQISAARLDEEQAELMALQNLYRPVPRIKIHHDAIQNALGAYESSFGLAREFRPLLLTLLWVEQALYQAARQRLIRRAAGVSNGDQQNVRKIGGGMMEETPINSVVRSKNHPNRAVSYLSTLAQDAAQLFDG